MNELFNRAMLDLARRREDAVREVAREYLPRVLRWAVDHPRVLRVLYRMRRSWSPRVVYGFDLGIGVAVTVRKDGTMIVTETFGIRRDD